MDEADVGNEYMDKWLSAQLEEHAYQLNHAVSAFDIGRCRNCSEKTDDSRSYCSEECRDDHQIRINAEKRNGR